MKIIFVCHKMNLGGTEKALLSLLHEMKKNDINITLILLEKGGVWIHVSYTETRKNRSQSFCS